MIVELHWSKVWSIHDLQSYCNNSIIHVHACPLQQTKQKPLRAPASCYLFLWRTAWSPKRREQTWDPAQRGPEIQPLQRGGHDGHDPSAKSEALCARQSGAWWSAWTSQGCWLMLADCSTENPVRKFSLPGVRTSVWASDLSPVGVLYTKMLSCLLGIPHTLWISVKRLIKSNSC